MKGEIALLLVGGLIGFLSSIGTSLVNEFVKRVGSLEIYYKVVHAHGTNGDTWGFYSFGNQVVFQIPIWVQFKNTSNSSRVVRDFNVLLFKDGRQVGEMTQITNTQDHTYGAEGSYSFVLEPRSIKEYEFHFALQKNRSNHEFDEVRFRYFDASDRVRLLQVSHIDKPWKLGAIERIANWNPAKPSSVIKR